MGEVYLAVDQRLGSAVALKRTFFAGDEMLGNAFEREARTLARMRHPVLPKVSDHFGEGDEQYLVMEHISGDDLSKRLEAAGKPFPVSWVLFWADQLLDALSYLHTHEPPIIHRDIKPQNLKLTDENHVILLDFGLSKTSTGQTNISQSGSTGSVVGYTPHYAPMEQIRGIGTSARSDLYSLAATLYQLMTNVVPVDALSRADSMLNELPDPIEPPHKLNPEVPPAVSEVLLRAMELSQEKRYANAREMQRVLRKAFNDIQQASSANTVAFSSTQADAIGVSTPASVGPENDQIAETPVAEAPPGNVVEPPSQKPDSDADLDATMAYDPYESVSGTKQSDVQTEVFIAGSKPFFQEDQKADSLSSPVSEVGSEDGFEAGRGAPSESYTPAATVPFMSVDQLSADVIEPSQSGATWTPPSEPQFFDDATTRTGHQIEEEEVPQFRSADSEPQADAVAASYATPAVAKAPAKKSSGKTIAVLGIVAALFLVGLGLAGGGWAYYNYGPGAATPTPEPTTEPTVEVTPEPTLEIISNSDTGNSNSNTGNTNENSNSGLFVSPTPVRTPETEPTNDPPPTPVTRPPVTPRPSTPRPQQPTPGTTRPPRNTRPPVTTRTPLP